MNLTIPGFQILRQLHDSDHTLVYRATRHQDQQPVILKWLKTELPSTSQLAHYQQEYELLSQLTLPGVIRTYGLEKWQDRLILVLEDFGGESLNFWLTQRTFKAIEGLPLAIQMAESLGQLHAAQIIHKDVNPNNLVWNPTTGQLKLIDFGIATRLPRETLALQNPNQLEGTLPYLSPEQTGRMNRALDYRTDLYSVGVTFYQLFTGHLPFETEDAMELVHCHLAKQPVPPHQLKADLPPVISHLILRLMAKAAEERYQSAWGVKADLEQILDQLTEPNLTGLQDLSGFQLGQRDFSDQFHLPQKLYGREEELQQLLTAFEEVATGKSQILLVAGYSGIGKSALVQELYAPITEKCGYFLAGKFDQFQRNIPYSAVVQAFRDLVRQLLTETQVQLEAWKTQILEAVGINGQVLNDVIPELELLLGPQPVVSTLPPTESQNRFNLVFQNFIRVFCQSSHPMVIFLDDLQWIDSASLKLMTLMMSDIPYLLLIGAYRDNEVTPTHSLILTLEEMLEQGLMIRSLTLAPLHLDHLNQWVSDTLHLPLSHTLPLAELVMAKTGGNPFFIGEFLKTLYTEALLVFHPGQHEWQWDLTQIQTRNITDNVVELMTSKIQRLPEQTQAVLKLAASVGNQFDLATLAVISQQSETQVQRDLWEALVAGLVQPLANGYKFVHDRIQQAAYSLIPEEERAALHWQIGQLLSDDTHILEERLFEVVDHLNWGLALADTQHAKTELARLNLRASQRAKTTTAYRAASKYLQTALDLLPADRWITDYGFTLALYNELTEVAYLNGDYAQVEVCAAIVLQQAQTTLDRVKVYEVEILTKTAENKLLEAVDLGLQALTQLGITLPPVPTPQDIEEALKNTTVAISNQNISALINQPDMTDANAIAALNLLAEIAPPTHLTNPPLAVLNVLCQVKLSLQYGNAPTSAFSYASYGMVLNGIIENFDLAFQCGQLALQIVDKFQARYIESKTRFIIGTFILYSQRHLKEASTFLLDAYRLGLETGDLGHVAYATVTKCQYAYFTGQDLSVLATDITNYSDTLRRLKHGIAWNWLQILHLTISPLLEKKPTDYESVSEAHLLTSLQQVNDKNGLYQFYLFQLTVSYLLGEYQTALTYANQAKSYLEVVTGMFISPLFSFYHSLCLLAISEGEVHQNVLPQVEKNQQKLVPLAAHAPMNFQHKYDLVEAERARVLGQKWEAAEFYEKAITGAKEHEYPQEEALAYELAAKFYLANGFSDFAQSYLTKAYQRYQRWGALAKLKHLENQYPHWLSPEPMMTTPVSSSRIVTTLAMTRVNATRLATSGNWLDLTSVLKAAQALSGEIVLEKLLTKMMHTVIENAGAQRGILILESQGHWCIQAEAMVDSETVTVLQALPLAGQVPISLLNYVIRTKQSLVFADLRKEAKYQEDDYVRTHSAKSVLVLTLLHQQRLTGVIYLENNLTTGAFTPDRFQVLTLLSSQMAISLDNARFVRELDQARQLAEEARQAEAQARQAAEVANQAKTAFLANVSHELRTPLNGILGYAQILQRDSQLTPKQQDSVQMIHQSGEHLLLLVSDIIDFSKLQTAQLELQLTDVHLGQLLTELVEWFEQQTRAKDLTFRYDAMPDLPLGLVADGKRLRQILLQLLGNAVKFTPQGNITFQVYSTPVSNQPGWHHFQFTVTDTGVGMTEDHLAKLFRPFEQASDWLHKTAGVGLGLCLVKQLLDLMGGQIHVDSQVGQGSRLVIDLEFAESIEWQASSATDTVLPPVVTAEAETEVPLRGPAPDQATQLCELAQIGDFFGILELVKHLEQQDAQLGPFVAKVRHWAKEFRDEAIEKLARQFMDPS